MAAVGTSATWEAIKTKAALNLESDIGAPVRTADRYETLDQPKPSAMR